MTGKPSNRTLLLALPLTLLLAGCPDSGDDSDGGSAGEEPETSDSPAVTLVSEATELETGSSDEITVTATVRDEDGIALADEPVRFRAAEGPSCCTIVLPEAADSGRIPTDGSGRASVDVIADTDNFNNRTVTIEADRFDGDEVVESGSIELDIVGTTLAVTGPDSVPIGQAVDYTIELKDGTGTAIANELVRVEVDDELTIDDGTSTTSSLERETNDNGRIEISVSGAAGAEGSPITATTPDLESAEGIKSVSVPSERLTFRSPDSGTLLEVDQTHDVTVEWQEGGSAAQNKAVDFSVSRGQIVSADTETDGSGEATAEIQSDGGGPVRVEAAGTASSGDNLEASRVFNYVGTTPDRVSLRANPTTIAPEEETTLLVRVLDDAGNPVATTDVEFVIARDRSGGLALDSNEVTTDADGVASTTLTAGPNDSGDPDDIKMEARIFDGATEIDSAGASITVTGEALSVSLGTGNEIEQPDSTTYRQPWTIFVTDSSGSAVGNQEVQINVEPVGYRKGAWVAGTDSWQVFGGLTIEDEGGNTRTVAPDEDPNLREDEVIVGINSPKRCVSAAFEPGDPIIEDVALLEDAEKGEIKPSDIATDIAGSVTTDSDGRADFNLNYQESEAPWVTFRIEATVQTDNGVDQTVRTKARDLAVLADDVNDTDNVPPGGDSDGAYGVEQSCSSTD